MGHIRKEELHESLINELEELGNIDLSGKQDKTDENLLTESKDLVGAINELFQSANNGKQLIASAIGEPLNAEDTFSAMSNDINGLLATFKTNMMNNGVTVESSDRFKSLIDKIATMVEEGEGKGIQFVSGEHVLTEVLYANNTTTTININLDFNPNYMIVYIPNLTSLNVGYSNQPDVVLTTDCKSMEIAAWYGSEYEYRGPKFNLSYNQDTITIYIARGATGYSLQIPKGTAIKWYAIGVGEEDTTLLDSLKSILAEEGVTTTEEDDMASLITKVDEEFNEKNNEMDSLNTTITLLNNQVNSLTNELAGKVTPAGDAVAGNVLSGKTFINSTGQVVTGTMANMSTHTQVADYVTWNENSIYLGIPAGAYVNASSTGYPEVYIEKTRLDSNLVPENIVSGKSICGVTGSVKSPSSLATTGDVSKTSKTYTNCIQLILNSSPLITVSSQSSNIIEKYKFTSTVSGRIALLMNFSNQYTGSYAANAIFHIYKNDSLITSLTQVQVSGNGWVYPSSTSSNTINCFVNLISDTFTVAKNDVISIRVETYGSGWGDKIARCYSIAVLGVFA